MRRWWREINDTTILLIVVYLLFPTPEAAAQSLYFSRNARTFETQQSSLVVKALAHSCLTLIAVPDSLPCNPAHTPRAKKSELSLEVLLSNGYSNLNDIRSLLDGDFTGRLQERIFSDNRVLQLEANAELNFVSTHVNARYTPLTVKALAVVRNESNPEVELYATEEQSVVLQAGYEVNEQILVGAQLRLVERNFIRQQFKLLVVGTDQGKALLKPQNQTAVYLEPGVTWLISKENWQPRVSAFIANLGYVSKEFDELVTPIELQFGVGLTPTLPWGSLDLALELRSMNYEESVLERLRLGALYRFGVMNLAGGVDFNGLSGGIFYKMDKINAGVMYSTSHLFNEADDFYTQTVYLQLGWQI